MPQYAFIATDRTGSAVQGTVTAGDLTLAADQVRQMGYYPTSLQVVAAEATVETGQPIYATIGAGETAQPQLSASPPGAIDLTQPVAALPARNHPAFSPYVSETEAAESVSALEPWQRGGPVEPVAAAPTLTLSSTGATLPASPPVPTQTLPTQGSAETFRAAGVRPEEIPFREGGLWQRSLWERFNATFIYPVFAGVPLKDLAAFFRQFGTLINAGLTVYQALVGLEANTQNGRLKEVARRGQEQAQAGGRFSEVMAAYPWIFQPLHVALARAAEQGGMLDRAMQQIAEYIEHELELRRLISRETFYPKLVLFVALMLLGRPGLFGGPMAIVQLVVGGMVAGSAPYSLWNYFLDTIGFGLFCLLPVYATVAVFRLFLFNLPGFREGYDAFKISIPGLGNLVRMFAVAKFMRTFAALYRAGFSMSAALEIAGDACGNWVIRQAAYRAVRVAQSGGRVADALASSRHFQSIAIDMFRTGETTGNLDTMLDKVAEFYEAEGKVKSHQLALVFSVFVFLCVALLVAIQVIGFYVGGAQAYQREMGS